MMVKPTVVELLKKTENRYSLVIATAKRARQISQGSKPMTDKLAADEIDEGKVKIYNQKQWEEIQEEKGKNDTSETEEQQ